MRRNQVLGMILILMGVVVALGHLRYIDGVWVLPGISAGLLILYVSFGGHKNNSNLGLLIPGSIIGAIGLFSVLNTYGLVKQGPVFLFFFGGAFLNVMFVHTLRAADRDWGARFWPIFPASVFLIIATASTLKLHINLSAWLMPIGLVVAGAIVLLKGECKGEQK